MSDGSVKIRLVEAVYVLGAILSIAILFITIPDIIGSYYQLFGGLTFLGSNPTAEALRNIVGAIASYGAGWAIRWIVTGKTKFRIDLSR